MARSSYDTAFRSTRHTRRIPSEWRGLVAYAESVIPEVSPGEYVKRRYIRTLLRHVLTLPTEQLEANYYYGLGEIMCGMAEILQHKDSRDRAINSAAANMVRIALRQRDRIIPHDKPFVPTMGDLTQEFAKEPFSVIAQASWRAMPAHRRTLVDVLTVAAIIRRYEVHNRLKMPRFLAHISAVEAARALYPAAYHIAQNSFAAASSVLGILLTGTHLGKDTPREVLGMPIPLSELENIRHSKSFIFATRLRDDEFVRGMCWRQEGESVVFDRSILSKPPPPLSSVPSPSHAHENRLACPALHADGLALDMARNILPRIITTAATIVPGNLPKG